jgi:hypothetical protein
MAQPHYVPVERARAGVHPLGGGGLGGAAANGGGLAALLDYARHGDAIVVVGIDRLGRNAAEVMMTIRDLGERGIVLRSLREGIDTSNATGRMVAGVLASLAELELELGRERRSAAREARRARGQPIGRPRLWTRRKLRWRSGCMQAEKPQARLPQRLGSAGLPSTAFWRSTPSRTVDRHHSHDLLVGRRACCGERRWWHDARRHSATDQNRA